MYDKNVKNRIIIEYKKGRSIVYISKLFNIPRTTIQTWIKKESKRKNKHTKKDLERVIYIYQNVHCHSKSSTKEKEIAIKEFLDKNPDFSVKEVCKIFELSHGTYYNYINRKVTVYQRDIYDNQLKIHIKQIFEGSKARLGPKKITIKIRNLGFKISIKRTTRLMKEMSLEVIYAKRKNIKPNEPHNTFLRNLLKRHFIQHEPNKVWVSDLTEIKVKGTPYYLCAIEDLFSRKIIAHRVHYQKTTNLVINTFKDAFFARNEPEELLFHSDRGSEFISYEFQNLLKTLKVKQSVSAPGTPYDNAVIESFYSTLKREEIHKHEYQDFDELKASISDYIEFYNNVRPHKTLKNLTPNDYEIRHIFSSSKHQ